MKKKLRQNQLADLGKILEISRAMVAATDLDSLLKLIIERSMELLDAERASIFLYDPQSEELISRIAAGVDEIRARVDRGISGATIRTGQTMNIPDAYADHRFNPGIDRKTGFRTRNILSIPLRDYHNTLVGVLQVINKRAGTFDDYDITLAETLAAQSGVAIERASLIDHYVEKQQMDRAMQIAKDIQRGLLPASNPAIEGFDVAGFSDPADETGGDMYDFMQLADGRWMLVIADATGHGIGSALMIAETRAMLRAIAQHGDDAGKVLAQTNELLSADLGDGRFVTCFFGLLNPQTNELSYASAGHGPLIFFNSATESILQAPATALPLGIMLETEFRDPQTVPLASGDIVLLTTDGIYEATNPEGEQFGIDRMLELLKRDRHQSAEMIMTNLREAVKAFTKGRPPTDDLTAVVVRKK